jgi:hypothetical protein
MSYAKLFGTITDSSLWSASKDARILFVSMLARADSTGFVEAALPGLARIANLSLSETEIALADLMAPDPHSKSPEHEGRRVVVVPRGWCLVNYEAYRERRNDEERREYMREYMQKYRKTSKLPVNKNVNDVNKSKSSKPQLAKAETETEIESKTEKNTLEARAPDEHDICSPSIPSNLSDAERWGYVRAEPWAKQLVAAGCKIGAQSWPAWRALTDSWPVARVAEMAATVTATERFSDAVEEALKKSGGQKSIGQSIRPDRIRRI